MHALYLYRPAFTRYRYRTMWWSTRLMRVSDPFNVAVVCAWLAYGSWERAKHEAVAAAVMGALLGASFVVAAVLLAAGLVWGGAWWELPTSVPWPIMQKLEALPILLATTVLSQWAFRIGRVASTPVFATLFAIAYITHASLLEPTHVGAVVFTMFAHQCSLVIAEVLSFPGWTDTSSGNLRWLDAMQVTIVVLLVFGYSVGGALPVIEGKRKEDFAVHARAKLLRNVAHDLVVNFLPAPVMKAVQERVAHPASTDSPELDDSEIVAWTYDPACVLQSDIVGFTALGSRVSPQELCR